ncbi:MAG: YicC family protein [Fusobacteriaceae bacterium]|nr:YicC family protein [Fusobacteriaceae bacterium]MBN2837274.1 YicC family protein [Fusobacteriaceae bacterium]
MRSMTGYASCTFENDIFKLSIEMKSVNNKNLNIRVKIPYILNFLENSIKSQISQKINRGTIDIRIDFEDKREVEGLFSYDINVAKAYMNLLNNLENEFGQKFENKLENLIKSGNIIKKSELNLDEELYSSFISEKLDEVISKINLMKSEEGLRLLEYFKERLDILYSFVVEVKSNSKLVVENYKIKLLERLNFIKEDIKFNEEDVLKEILIFADRCDISEEISRLESHVEAFKNLISSGKNDVGKKMDFILQEIFRELNTTGVKSNYYEISKLIVDAKNEVEKMREQSMNIE